ncbi:Large exoproteins involved in heme utilization or adhesion [Hyphomicrobiales bacterium]|nr:Large exoproteins involved in heme utilization or adhesion [Hyphomicrobiales bacterium]CAH1701516.1 Large exoproteins involved in heme utilization or adhesion [Hyphomicrobiales bacterium]CAI0345473.1 DUF3971 domain-containing protein [Hyphomicrobiales bacterium]
MKRGAKAGLATICVAATVAILVLAGAAITLLVTGIIPLSGLEGRISTAIEERLGPGWTVDAAAAELSRTDGHSQLRVRQVTFRHTSGAVIRAPEAVLGYEPMALLKGDIRLVSIDLRGVNVRLGVNKDGALVVNADSAPAEAPPTPTLPDAGQWNAFTGIMGAISMLARGDGLLGSLETAGINGARLSLVDPDGRQKAGLEDVDIRLTRAGEHGTRLTMKGRTGQRWKDIAVDMSTEADGTQRADIDILRFEPAEIVALALGTGLSLEGLPLQGKATLRQTPDGRRSITAQLGVEAGRIRFPDSPLPPLAVDSVRLQLASGADLTQLDIQKFEFKAGATQLAATGSLRADNGAWQLAIDAGGQLAGLDATDVPVRIDSLKAALKIDPVNGAVAIEQAAIRGPAATVDMTALVQKQGESPLQRFSIKAANSDVRALLAIWPEFTSTDVHQTLHRQLAAGRMKALTVDLDLPAEDHARLVRGHGLPDKALLVTIDAEQVRYLPDPGLPPLADATVTGKVTGRTVQLAIGKAAAELGNGRQLQLSEGSFAMPDFAPRRPQARIGFRTQGPMDALAALFTFPALKDFNLGQIDPGAIKGTSDLKVAIALPLAPDLRPDEIAVTASGTLTNLSSDTLLGSERLDGGNLTVNVDRNGLSLRGEARIGGDKGTVELKQNAKGQGEVSLQLNLDAAARQRRGFGADSGITGTLPVRVTKTLGKGSDGPPRVEVDLTKVGLDGVVPGLTKPAGRAGKVSFLYVADADGPDLEDFTLDAAPALIKGRIELNKQNGLDSASFSQFRISPGDNLKVDVKRDGNVTKLTVRGAVADLRPFIKDIQGAAPAARGDRGGSKGGDFDVDLDVPILTGFNNEAITNGTLKLAKRGGEIRSANFQGRIGKADVSVRQGRPGEQLVVQSENGGSLLRFLDLYNRAHGGDLILTMGSGENQRGDLMFRNFVVRDEPALRRVAGAQPSGGDRAEELRIDTTEVAFTKLKAEFSRSASRLDIADMVIWGQQVGFTLQGHVDYGRDRVDIGGTFVPGYAFNNAFAQVPVVGALLGGGSQYGGLFAVNFRISGPASAPTMSINPLSAIAPGILRRFVDPLGGSPVQRPIQPGQAPLR